jgi:hypothetical protein
MENAFLSDISEILHRDVEALINEIHLISDEKL